MSFYLDETYAELFTEIGCISISVCLSEDVLRFLGINRGFIYLLVVCTYYIVVKSVCLYLVFVSTEYLVEASFQTVKISILTSHSLVDSFLQGTFVT